MRRTVAKRLGLAKLPGFTDGDPWAARFDGAQGLARAAGQERQGPVPFWIYDSGDTPVRAGAPRSRVPLLPMSREQDQFDALVLNRCAVEQPSHEDLVRWLQKVGGERAADH